MIEGLTGECPRCKEHSLFTLNSDEEIEVENIDEQIITIPIICHHCSSEGRIVCKYIGVKGWKI